MKAKDIIVGQEYAVGSAHYPERAEVLEVGELSRRVYSGARWDFGGHTSSTMACRVRVLDRKTGEPRQREEVYALAQILRPWTEQLVLDESERLRRVREAEAAAELRNKADTIQDALKVHGVRCTVRPREGTIEIKVSGDAIASFMALVRA